MTRIDDYPPDGDGAFRVGEAVQLREAHDDHRAGTRGRIVGFYAVGIREALLVLDDGEEVRVPCAKLEPMP